MDSEVLPAAPLAEWLHSPSSTAHIVPIRSYQPTGIQQEKNTNVNIYCRYIYILVRVFIIFNVAAISYIATTKSDC